MEVSGRAIRILLEAAEAGGIPPERIVEALPYDAEHLTDPRSRIEWSTFLAVNERVADLVGRDPERLRQLGEHMLRMPFFAFMQRMARLLVTPTTLFELGNRWVIPMVAPDLTPPETRVLPDGRIVVEFDTPAAPRSAEWFFHIYTGNLRATPMLLGLPAAVVDAQVGPHRLVATIRVPASHTILERTRRSLRALRGRRQVYELLDGQRRELERAFATSLAAHHTFRELLDNLPTLVMIHREGKILWVNRTWVKKLGWQHPDEVVGRPVVDSTHPSSRPHVEQRMALPIASAVDPLTTVRLLRRDGETVTVEVSPAQSVDFDGPARLVVAVDVSERVALQQRLVTADRITSIGLLGAGVAHEINNPLAYAMGSVELTAREVSKLADAPPRIGELLGTALEGLGRVREIVRDLRMLSRADDGTTSPTDVRDILESTLTLAATALSDRVRVVREYRDVPLAAANGPRLGQVALNLVLNAVESMPEPGVLRVSTLVDSAGRVAFEVEDTGAGIAPDVMARIFDPFFTTKPIGRGTGLGLAICQQIVAGLGGEITVRSTVGRGSVFRVSLPPAEALSPVLVPESRGAGPGLDGARRRVLVVDDEPQLVSVLERMLTAHDVASTSSAAEALELLSQGQLFEVVFCDLMMAGMTGMQLYEELSRVRPEMAARVVFMTGGAFTNEAREFLARVPNRHLEKPFTIEQIEAALRLSVSA